MRVLIILSALVYLCSSIYDTTLVANTTYLQLRIGEFKKISLPYNFTTYYSIDIGKSEATSKAGVAEDVCTVEERQFDLLELDYRGISGKNMYYKDVVTQYDTLLQRRFLIDMVIANNILFVVFTDTVKVITLDTSNDQIGQISKNLSLPSPLPGGKLIKASDTSFYLVGPNTIYKISQETVIQLEGYNTVQGFESASIVNNKMILIAAGKNGVQVYVIQQDGNFTYTETLQNDFFNTTVDISDIQSDGKIVYLLSRQGEIFKLISNQQNNTLQRQNTYFLNRTGCQNMELHDNQLYITCPQLHRISFSETGIVDKSFENPNFNPRSIVFFNSIVILVGHNLAKIYNEGVEMGYYHNFIMRKLVPFQDRILIGSDYGLALTSWDVTQPEITCGLKRRGATQKYEGKVSTTINVVAECNEQYFNQNNIPYKEQLKNDACLYHFPISINFWVGKQINYLPFKIGVSLILLVCIAVLIGWFILNSKVKNLTSAIKNYTALAPSTNTVHYAHMVEENPDDDQHKTPESYVSGNKDLHQIGD